VAVAPRKKPSTRKVRFKVFPFTNPSGKRVWRVSGCKSDGSRVRENYRDENKAKCRQIDLEAEYLQQPRETSIRATKLSDEQLQIAELAILRLGDEWSRLVDAVDHWKQTGGQPNENNQLSGVTWFSVVNSVGKWRLLDPQRV
jgi:hypothetical protein